MPLTCIATWPIAWKAVGRVSQSPLFLTVYARKLTSRPIASVLLELAKEEEHCLVEIIGRKVVVIVGGEGGDEFNHCSSHEGVAVILVLQDLVADLEIALVHKLVNEAGQLHDFTSKGSVSLGIRFLAYGLSFKEKLFVAQERTMDGFGRIKLESSLSLLKDEVERLTPRLAIALSGDV